MTTSDAVDPTYQYPWQKEHFFTGNQAVVNLRENLLSRLKTERGVHCETLLSVIGAITGFASLYAAMGSPEREGKPIPPVIPDAPIPEGGLMYMLINTGQKFFFGDLLNSYLVEQKGRTRLTLWSMVAGAGIASGISPSELPSLPDMFEHITKTMGTSEYGIPRVSENHRSHLTLYQSLQLGWPLANEIFQMGLAPPLNQSKEQPLAPEYWPAVAALVAAQFLAMTKETLPQVAGIIIIMETAIAASKLDPTSVFATQNNNQTT